MITAEFDGCCEPRNPGGHAAYGTVIRHDGKLIHRSSVYVGHGPKMSNNVAEYSGVLEILKVLWDQGYQNERVLIKSDSMLVVEQLNRRWKIRGGLYVPFCRQAKKVLALLVQERGLVVEFLWVSRDDNVECDVLSKDVLRQRGVRFRIQPEE